MKNDTMTPHPTSQALVDRLAEIRVMAWPEVTPELIEKMINGAYSAYCKQKAFRESNDRIMPEMEGFRAATKAVVDELLDNGKYVRGRYETENDPPYAAARAAMDAPMVVEKPVCYMRHLNGKPDWSEDCIVGKASDGDGYEVEEGYTFVPLYSHPSPAEPAEGARDAVDAACWRWVRERIVIMPYGHGVAVPACGPPTTAEIAWNDRRARKAISAAAREVGSCESGTPNCPGVEFFNESCNECKAGLYDESFGAKP